MIIFGWRTKVYIIGLLHKQLCDNCHNEEYWLLKKTTKWFTLFFIGVIPAESKYIASCPICDKGYILKNDEVKKIQPISELNLKLAKGSITSEKYNLALHNLEPSQILDPRLLQDAPNIKKYLVKTHQVTPLRNKLIGFILLIPVIPLFILGDGQENYNGYLVLAGWIFVIAAVIFFNKKTPTFQKT